MALVMRVTRKSISLSLSLSLSCVLRLFVLIFDSRSDLIVVVVCLSVFSLIDDEKLREEAAASE